MKEKIIGLYQLITGIFGVLLLLFNITKVISDYNLMSMVVIGIALYAFTAYAGYAMLNGLKNLNKFTLWAQGLQSFSIITGGFQYLFTASAFMAFILGSNNGWFKFQMAPINFHIGEVSPLLSTEFMIYPIPLIIIYLITRHKGN